MFPVTFLRNVMSLSEGGQNFVVSLEQMFILKKYFKINQGCCYFLSLSYHYIPKLIFASISCVPILSRLKCFFILVGFILEQI